MKFVALVAVVNEDSEEMAIKSAKEAGAGSVTILKGRNLGLKEKKIFFGLTLEENVSVLIFVLPRKISMVVFKRLRDDLKIGNDSDNSLLFTVPLSHVAGLDMMELHKFEDEIKNRL